MQRKCCFLLCLLSGTGYLVAQTRPLPDSSLVATWFYDSLNFRSIQPYWATDFLLLRTDTYDRDRIFKSASSDNPSGFCFTSITKNDQTACVLYGKQVTNLVEATGTACLVYKNPKMEASQPRLGYPLPTKFKMDSLGRYATDTAGRFSVTYFVPDSILRRKDSFDIFIRRIVKGPAPPLNIKVDQFGVTDHEGPITVHITSNPVHCLIYRIDQDIYDLDIHFKEFERKNRMPDANFLAYLKRFVLVEGRTSLDLPQNESNSIIFLQYGAKLSPPLPCIPRRNQPNNIYYDLQ